jgi:hypothetical protein
MAKSKKEAQVSEQKKETRGRKQITDKKVAVTLFVRQSKINKKIDVEGFKNHLYNQIEEI